MNEFKKGDKVKFEIAHKGGFVRGKGEITRTVPRGAKAGAARLKVKDSDGHMRSPFPGQCEVARGR